MFLYKNVVLYTGPVSTVCLADLDGLHRMEQHLNELLFIQSSILYLSLFVIYYRLILYFAIFIAFIYLFTLFIYLCYLFVRSFSILNSCHQPMLCSLWITTNLLEAAILGYSPPITSHGDTRQV